MGYVIAMLLFGVTAVATLILGMLTISALFSPYPLMFFPFLMVTATSYLGARAFGTLANHLY